MKLTIVRLQNFSAQDRCDLQKIWPQTDIERLEGQLSAQHQLYAARFNDRLLAALRLEIVNETGRISQLTVREVTRRRGVGLYLVEDTLAQNPQIAHWSLTNEGSETEETVAAFAQAIGFNFCAAQGHYVKQI